MRFIRKLLGIPDFSQFQMPIQPQNPTQMTQTDVSLDAIEKIASSLSKVSRATQPNTDFNQLLTLQKGMAEITALQDRAAENRNNQIMEAAQRYIEQNEGKEDDFNPMDILNFAASVKDGQMPQNNPSEVIQPSLSMPDPQPMPEPEAVPMPEAPKQPRELTLSQKDALRKKVIGRIPLTFREAYKNAPDNEKEAILNFFDDELG